VTSTLGIEPVSTHSPHAGDNMSSNYEQMSYRGFLAELLLAECDDRARRRSERRITAAPSAGSRPPSSPRRVAWRCHNREVGC
jgi:hypothetical protein